MRRRLRNSRSPEVCVIRCRTWIVWSNFGSSGMCLRMSSSRDNRPRSAWSMIAKAVNCFEVEPMFVRVSSSKGIP